uniref:Dishevelled n=1 Tax=Acrobeloides nanus TaxID=290746 RepID=A0A914DMK2_9BILA
MSSMTETSMALEVITVTLNMDTVNFLGISIVGQSSSRGDNGIYVANIMKGGAVALDGRIEPGDMILQVNDISFENFTNDQAVEVLKEAVSRRGTIKLTVAKSFDSGAKNCFIVPSREPVRPIDTHAWVQHTNNYVMNSIPEGSEGAPTPVPGQFSQYCRPASSSATSNGSGGQQTIVGPAGVLQNIPMRLDTKMDKKLVVRAMAMPNSGLDIRNRTWLKIPIPMSFLGSALVDWLMEHVDGLRDRKDGRRYASELLKEKLIAHVVNKITFTEQCYYVFGEECADFVRLRQAEETGSRSDIGSIPAPPPALPHAIPHGHLQWPSNSGHSMVGELSSSSTPMQGRKPMQNGNSNNFLYGHPHGQPQTYPEWLSPTRRYSANDEFPKNSTAQRHFLGAFLNEDSAASVTTGGTLRHMGNI